VTRRERGGGGEYKIVDVISKNTQSVYNNFVAFDWSKKVGVDRYAGRYKQPISKINFWYRLFLTVDTKNKIPFLFRVQLSADKKIKDRYYDKSFF
jgi:hypothetical protein